MYDWGFADLDPQTLRVIGLLGAYGAAVVTARLIVFTFLIREPLSFLTMLIRGRLALIFFFFGVFVGIDRFLGWGFADLDPQALRIIGLLATYGAAVTTAGAVARTFGVSDD
jgi:hypothetical protein